MCVTIENKVGLDCFQQPFSVRIQQDLQMPIQGVAWLRRYAAALVSFLSLSLKNLVPYFCPES